MRTFLINRGWIGVVLGLALVLGVSSTRAAPPEGPLPFTVNAKAAVMGDVDTGEILYEMNGAEERAPASLTKVMTLYLVYEALANGQLSLEDRLPVSEKAWRMKGSKTFVKVGDTVKVRDLIRGIAVQSGNDACIVMAEHLAGSEAGFADLMNAKAKSLGMHQTHFVNATGFPAENHFSTAQDLFLLARALVSDFPQYSDFVKEKEYSFNGIRQYNRNRLLWQDSTITGLKTGHTRAAGYCLISTNEKDGQRLASVVLGAKSSKVREKESLRLLRYGNRTFSTERLFDAGAKVKTLRVWKGDKEELTGVLQDDITITIPRKERGRLEVGFEYQEPLLAPIGAGDVIGSLIVKLGEREMMRKSVHAEQAVKEGGILTSLVDTFRLRFGF